jgi:transposase InsO family protein
MTYSLDERICILNFADENGVQATIKALELGGKNINRSTIGRWKRARERAKQSNGYLTESQALEPRSTKPNTYKQSSYNPILYEFIKVIRKRRYKVGKHKLATIIKQACTTLSFAVEIQAQYGDGKTFMLYGIEPICSSTIGRIIKELKRCRSIPRSAKEYNAQKEVYLDGGTGTVKIRKTINRSNLQGKPKNRKPKDYKPVEVGEQIQLDAVTVQTTIPDISKLTGKSTGTLKRKNIYFICGIDLVSRLAYCRQYDHLSSKSTTDFIKRFEEYLTLQTQTEIKIQKVQTDNGQENHKHFHQYLTTNNIEHFWNYPRSPKMNAFIEKFNHTVQAECIEWHLHHLRHNQQYEFTRKLDDFLTYYNNQRPHQSLQYLSPMQFYRQQLQNTSMVQM